MEKVKIKGKQSECMHYSKSQTFKDFVIGFGSIIDISGTYFNNSHGIEWEPPKDFVKDAWIEVGSAIKDSLTIVSLNWADIQEEDEENKSSIHECR